jgi:hypothetical protein
MRLLIINKVVFRFFVKGGKLMTGGKRVLESLNLFKRVLYEHDWIFPQNHTKFRESKKQTTRNN